MPKRQVPKICIMCGSKGSKDGELIHLYKLCENLGIIVKLLKPSWRICTRCFDHHVIRKIRLHKFAIPTLNLCN